MCCSVRSGQVKIRNTNHAKHSTHANRTETLLTDIVVNHEQICLDGSRWFCPYLMFLGCFDPHNLSQTEKLLQISQWFRSNVRTLTVFDLGVKVSDFDAIAPFNGWDRQSSYVKVMVGSRDSC